jgi:glucose-6-phosphate isomerase
MSDLSLDYQNTLATLTESQISELQPEVDKLHQELEAKKGKGCDYLGWLHLPSLYEEKLLADILEVAQQIRNEAEALVCIGIGGSYLGSKAAIDFLSSPFANGAGKGTQVYFAGHNISSDYISNLIDEIENKSFYINVISKSGTTTEPALAFRLLKDVLVKKYGEEQANKRIIVTTDKEKGALKSMANEKGFRAFEIPDDVGGRFSVLTPVGLLPMAVAGIDIRQLLEGAAEMESVLSKNSQLESNDAYLYAVIRNLLYRKGKTIEILSSFHPSFKFVLEWWKQLSGESEGKESKGIFPASVEFTTDLHSMGQWVQEGNRILFETFLILESSKRQVTIPLWENDGDGLNYLSGKTLDYVNEKAFRGTAAAHLEGGVPNMTITIKERTPKALGQLFYFFERAIAMSGYLLKVNPFDQPGVEMYKKNMFMLLNKPGYERG